MRHPSVQAERERARAGRRLLVLPRQPLVLALGVVVTVVFGYIALHGVRLEDVGGALAQSNYWWTIPSVAVLAVAIFLRAVRWRYVFAPEKRPPLGPVTTALLIGYLFNNLLPARAGEAARIVALHQRTRTSRAEATATVVIERVFDVASLLLLLFVTLPWLPDVVWIAPAIVLAVVLLAVLLVTVLALALYGEQPLRFLLRPLARLPVAPAARVDRVASNLARGLASLMQPRLAVGAFLLTSLSWLVMAVSFWLLTLGFDLELPLIAGLLVVIAIGLAMILPALPSSLGVFEAATLVALAAFGVSGANALSYALVLHAVNFFPYVAVGAVILYAHVGWLRRRT